MLTPLQVFSLKRDDPVRDITDFVSFGSMVDALEQGKGILSVSLQVLRYLGFVGSLLVVSGIVLIVG